MTLDPIVAKEFYSSYQDLKYNNMLPSDAKLDAAINTFRVKFGPERLLALQGEDLLLAMHSRGDQSGMDYWLANKEDDEFSTSLFGSIRGGSSSMFGVYYDLKKSVWKTGSTKISQQISIERAIEIAHKQRDELVAGTDILEVFSAEGTDLAYKELQDQLDKAAPTVSNKSWGHKYFDILFPEKLNDFHDAEFQYRQLSKLRQIPPVGNGRYICGGAF